MPQDRAAQRREHAGRDHWSRAGTHGDALGLHQRGVDGQSFEDFDRDLAIGREGESSELDGQLFRMKGMVAGSFMVPSQGEDRDPPTPNCLQDRWNQS